MTPNKHAFALSVLDRSHPEYSDFAVMIQSNLAHYIHLFPWADSDDLHQAAWIGLYEGALRFDPSRGVKLKTYANYYVRKHIQDELTPLQKYLNNTSPLDPDWDAPISVPIDNRLEVEEFLEILTPIQRFVAEGIMQGMSPAEISRAINVSKPRISTVIGRMRTIWLRDSILRSGRQSQNIN